MAPETKRKIGEILLDHKFITEDQLAQGIGGQAADKARNSGARPKPGFK